jgi:hypothetical protein
MSDWWERAGNKIAYPGLLQGNHPHCVYAAIAGALNHLTQKHLWTVQSLFNEHQKAGARDANFDVADTAIAPVANTVKKLHHNTKWSHDRLCVARIRDWLSSGSIVILSMELLNDAISNRGGWHMFSLVADDQGQFQVWDTNGFEGFLTESELFVNLSYPSGWSFRPHKEEDTLVLMPKNTATSKGGGNR